MRAGSLLVLQRLAQCVQQLIPSRAARACVFRTLVDAQQVHNWMAVSHLAGKFAHFEVGQHAVEHEGLGGLGFQLRHRVRPAGSFAHLPAHRGQLLPKARAEMRIGARQQYRPNCRFTGDCLSCQSIAHGNVLRRGCGDV
jgi:hypothetical protein